MNKKKLKKSFCVCIWLCILVFQFSGNENNADNKSLSQRLIFINAALQYLGTPYKYAGCSEEGMDCSGLIYKTALDTLNLALPRSARELGEFVEKIDDEEVQPGDLLFFNTTGRISHVGIYLGSGNFVHSSSDDAVTGVVITSLTNVYWKKCYRFAGRILEPEDIFLNPIAAR
ncbi:NlpC/P60 family protein [Treponema phagedenis]|uniref:NlpC/P60 family protein n=1 Tax=Treponema phagedenis TaxID=162 RepID=A0A0B7GUJ5_TREPH|nr:C40 family peptidase [Treponema phagedenis]NVP23747.1 C40 family peptidase [Treponema phagedenis]QEJ94433.1 NlpC/P60 family protein [Treponema phagedenis]QEJ97497.1 NlpC/P60 family protein [Treponema phagedenis]QEK01686.1 NlpC/P60 family protein [Treponema phagedenis]QEK03067.1 NlpC/P60 family protein [Treponema phagedenis]